MEQATVDPFVGKRIMQPKKEIMSFLASRGVRVPVIYDSPSEAAKFMHKHPIMLRSEHPQDYEGSSDLFPNDELGEMLSGGIPPEKITEEIISSYPFDREQIKIHCKLLRLNYKDFIRDLSHSAWETIEGTNRVVYADPAVKDKYHIIALHPFTYNILEGKELRCLSDRFRNPITTKETPGLVKLYEQIRELLDLNHCYIVETQTARDNQTHFAVQVHRGVDSQKVDFRVDELREKGSVEFNEVRGATSPEGEDLLLTRVYPHEFTFNPKIVKEDASSEASVHYVARAFSEIMFRRRKLHVFRYRGDYQDLEYELGNHCSRNSLFKPKCSVLCDNIELYNVLGTIVRNDGLVQKRVHFVSDGRKAYMRLIK